MNKLETEFFEHLKNTLPNIDWRAQAKRFRLGNGIWYKPDVTGIVGCHEHAYEVKGPYAFRGGFENLKVAASTYPEIRWHLVWKHANGVWHEQKVLP